MLPAIRVDNLSKRYRIGSEEQRRDTLAGTAAHLVSSPFRNLSQIRRLSNFGSDDRSDQDVFWALSNVSFEVSPGEIVGIVGRNGAGKSTLLKILSRITNPTTGRAEVYGRVSSLLEVGTGFHPELTGRENIFLNGTVLGMSRKEVKTKLEAIVDFSGVEKFIDTPVKRYSSGMQVRLAFSVAAHLEPEILLIDEVLAVGDAEFQKKCLGRMETIAGEGRTVLFVSHNISAVNRLCPRAILLDEGKVLQDGPSPEVTAVYLTGSGQDVEGRKTWSLDEAPGSEVKLTQVELTDTEGQTVSLANIETPLRLRLSYVVNQPGIRFRCVAGFFTQGTCAFWSNESVETVKSNSGCYRSTVTIPGNLLSEGEYVVDVSMFTSVGGTKKWYLTEDNVIGFQVYDPMTGSSARGDYAQRFEGVMRPLLAWELEPPPE